MAELKTKDDLDLFELLLKAIRIIVSNLWLIIALFLVGVAFGLTSFFLSKKVYESRMIVSSKILTDTYAKVMFENLNKHLLQQNIDILVEQLHLSPNAVRQIVSVEIESLSSAPSNSPKESDNFIITAEVFDQAILPELQSGLVNYLEDNEYVKVRIEQAKATYRQLLDSARREIQDMQAIKNRIASGEFFQDTRGNVMFDPTIVNSKILELTERMISYQNNLELSNSVYVIDNFTKYQRHSKPRLSISLASGSVTGLVLAGMFIFFKTVRIALSKTAN